MIGRRGFLKALFGASLGAVTRPVGALIDALMTRKVSNQILSFVTGEHICDAKMFFMPYIPLLTPAKVEETVYAEGWLNGII